MLNECEIQVTQNGEPLFPPNVYNIQRMDYYAIYKKNCNMCERNYLILITGGRVLKLIP